jgi:protein subunit release factor A
MKSVIVEIRAAEGGADSKLLVEDQLAIYLAHAARRSL